MGIDAGLTAAERADLDRFELELRKLAGVTAVGFEGAGPDRPLATEELLTVHLLINDPGLRAEVEVEAMDLGRLHHPHPLRIAVSIEGEEPGEGISAGPEAASAMAPSRVRLASVGVAGDSGALEVTLAHGETRGLGRAAAGTPAAAVVATLAALRQMGWSIPFEVESAVRLAMGSTGAVLVHLVGRDGERLGVSSGANAEEAAVKATLQALNRWLDDPGRRPVTLRPMTDAP